MFHEFDRKIDISDYDHKGIMRMDAILKIFQEAAIGHSERVGYKTETFMGMGNIWMHNKNLFMVHKLPDFKQSVRMKTWSRGMDKFKGFRNYELYADGEKCVSGSSIWIYLNIEKRRPVRVSQEMLDRYDAEDVSVFNDKVKSLDFTEPSADFIKNIAVRPSDYDVNGHVSNVSYGAYFDIVLKENNIDITDKYVSFSYLHEIKLGVKEVEVRMSETDKGLALGVYSEGECNCLCGVSNE